MLELLGRWAKRPRDSGSRRGGTHISVLHLSKVADSAKQLAAAFNTAVPKALTDLIEAVADARASSRSLDSYPFIVEQKQ
jgi:hypothetical protein